MNYSLNKIEAEIKMKNLTLALFTIFSIMIFVAQVDATDEELFSANVPPDALIILDMSTSMNWDPAGNSASFPNRRIDIARSVIKDLLDDNDDGDINTVDEQSLNVRLGYMRFRNIYVNAPETIKWDDGDPFNGNIIVFKGKTEIGSNYNRYLG